MDILEQKIPLHKKILSYFHPVWLASGSGDTNPYLELLLYRGRVQLATRDALYSDGVKYTPATAIVKALKPFLPRVNKVLVMGVGLGSFVQVVRAAGFNPEFTLVEIDMVVLKLAMDILKQDSGLKLKPICEDAYRFIEFNDNTYDLIFIDIFDGRTVPGFVTSHLFLEGCRLALAPGGRLTFNYIAEDTAGWDKVSNAFTDVFPDRHIVYSDINRLFISEL